MKRYLGIDLGGTKIAAGVCGENGAILSKHILPTGRTRSFSEIAEDMAIAARKTAESIGAAVTDFSAIGIGAPVIFDPKTGEIADANNLGWQNVPLAETMKERLGIPCILANDADCAALAESQFGAGCGYESMLMITLGTGIGGGFIQNGQIFKGGTGEGFEPGHLVLYPDGELCTCGKKGCLETYCSALALIRETEKALSKTRDSVLRKLCEKDKMKLTAKIVFDAARCGDEIPQKIVNRYLHDLGCGLSSIICLFRPHAVILGGGIANEGETLLAPLRQYLTKNLYAAEITGVPALQKAALGEDAGIVGAALLTKNFYNEITP